MSDIAIIAIMIVLLLLAFFVMPSLMVTMAIPKVIKIFRKKGAVGIKNAKAVEELGLQPKSFTQRMMKVRDHKPRALQFLIQVKVVQATNEGKVYLCEDMLAQTRWRNL